MKRFLILLSIFLLLLVGLCLASCSCGECSAECVETTAPSIFDCDSILNSCSGSLCTDLSGCRVDCSCLECTWYPLYNGCAPSMTVCGSFGEDCTVPACILFGFDVCYCNPYDGYDGLGKMYPTVEAVEGVDYEIISTSISTDYGVYGELGQDFSDIDWDELFDSYLTNDYEANVRYTVKYRAKTNLSGAKCEITGTKGGYFGNEKMHFSDSNGNGNSASGFKEDTVYEGEHYLYVTMSLLPHEFRNMTIDDIKISVYKFKDGN